jgi:hypothetical protein
MAERRAFCVMLQVETTDPRLTLEAIEDAFKTAGGTATLRRAVLQHLPQDVTRLISVMPVNQARMLMMLHEAAGEDIAKQLREMGIPAEDTNFLRPPPDYVPPTTE